MKKLAMALLVSAFFAAPVFAQNKDKSQAEWDNKVKTELRLNPEQVSKYDALSKEYQGKIDAVKKDATLTEAQQKQKKLDLQKEQETKLADFVTPEQLAKYKALMSKRKDKS